MNKYTKDELIELVRRIQDCEGSEEEIDKMMEELETNVPHPEISDLIFFDEKTPEEIIELAINYKYINL